MQARIPVELVRVDRRGPRFARNRAFLNLDVSFCALAPTSRGSRRRQGQFRVVWTHTLGSQHLSMYPQQMLPHSSKMHEQAPLMQNRGDVQRVIGSSSSVPAQSLLRPSHTSGLPGNIAASESLQSPSRLAV
jgi:hypothetical protein